MFLVGYIKVSASEGGMLFRKKKIMIVSAIRQIFFEEGFEALKI